MKMYRKIIKLFLRLSLAVDFLSAVADRFGIWNNHVAWGSWDQFVAYTHILLPWLSGVWVQIAAGAATAAEIIFAIFLLIGWKTSLFAKLSGILLLLFALSMSFSTGVKTAFDASVYAASAGAFALGAMRVKFLELDSLVMKRG
jgi:uncharacterized membrane protein YphA (DoxX/SURF4 family)